MTATDSKYFDESIEVINYDLGPEEGIKDHDQVCISQAGKLLQIGYLEYETEVYGSAYFKDDEIHYYISTKEDTMDKFQRNCYLNHIYPTPARYFSRRYDLVNDTEEDVKTRFRLDIAFQLKADYPPIFFEAIHTLTSEENSNEAFSLMNALSKQLDSCFDLHQLKLFGNLAEMLFQGRHLTDEGHLLLNQWLSKEYEKISIEPIASGCYRRTYSGFAYQTPEGRIKHFIDAFSYMAYEKQQTFIAKGYIVTPILTITYYADSFNHLSHSKKLFQAEIEKYLTPMYIQLMEILRKLPPSVNQKVYHSFLEEISITGSRQAKEAFLYYGYLWNIKFD